MKTLPLKRRRVRDVRVPHQIIAALALPLALLVGTASLPLAATPTSSGSHDLYNPARTALVNAQKQLAESSRQEQDILGRIRQMHSELDSSLALLANAAELDPAMKQQIVAVRERLAALQDKPALCPMDSSSSLSVYSQLLNDLQALIDHY